MYGCVCVEKLLVLLPIKDHSHSSYVALTLLRLEFAVSRDYRVEIVLVMDLHLVQSYKRKQILPNNMKSFLFEFNCIWLIEERNNKFPQDDITIWLSYDYILCTCICIQKQQQHKQSPTQHKPDFCFNHSHLVQ